MSAVNRSIRLKQASIAAGVVAASIILIAYACLHLNQEPFVCLIAAASVPLAIFLMRKWPVILLTGLMFVGNFKTVAAEGIAITDPTLILLLLTGVALMIEVLFILSGGTGSSMGQLFRGQGPTIFLFVLFTLVFVTSVIYSPDAVYGTLKTTRFATFEILSFIAPLVLLKDQTHLRQLVIAMVVASVALVLTDMVQLIHPSQALVEGEADITRIGDAMLFAICILTALYRGVARSRMVNNTVIAVLAIGMIITAARSALLALIITVLISALLIRGGVVSRKKILVGTLIIGLVSTIGLHWLQALPWAKGKVSSKEGELASIAQGSLVTGGTITDRLIYNESALEALQEHPLFGLGAGGWAGFYSKDKVPLFPHNFLLEVAAEQGLIGLVLLLTLLTVLFRAAYRIRDSADLGFVLPVLMYFVICNALTGDVENRQLWFWFGTTAAASRMMLVSTRSRVDLKNVRLNPAGSPA